MLVRAGVKLVSLYYKIFELISKIIKLFIKDDLEKQFWNSVDKKAIRCFSLAFGLIILHRS
jgi:hypothetical protein